MNKTFHRFFVSSGCIGLAIATGLLPFTFRAAADELLARSNGRCRLVSGDFQVFDGHCVAKQKRRDRDIIFQLDLDNGMSKQFIGPNRDALQVSTHDGIHNARFREQSDSGLFTWEEDGRRNSLYVKLDTIHDPYSSYNTPSNQAAGVAAGVAVGALISSLLNGGRAPAVNPQNVRAQAPIQSSQSPTPVTRMTQVNPNTINARITEGEFEFYGTLQRTAGNTFIGSDGQVRVMYDRGTSRVTVINEVTGTEFYNYFFSLANEGAL